MHKIGLADALTDAIRSAEASERPGYTQVIEAIDLLLAANRDAGIVRADVSAEDVMLATAGLWQLDPTTQWRPRAERLLNLLMYGLTGPTPQ